MNPRKIIIAAMAVLIVPLAGCGNGSATIWHNSQPRPAATAAVPNANALVCRNYRKQLAWKYSVVNPTLATALQWSMDIAADSALAQPGTKLARDLNDEYAVEKAAWDNKKPSRHYVNGTVTRDCQP